VGSGHASCSPRLIGGRFSELPRALASAGPMVWRWQHRFAEAGVEGLLHEYVD
jgi:hypothetical protein